MPTEPKIARWGGECMATIQAIILREEPTREELCGLAEQLVVNAASLLTTAFLGEHQPRIVEPVVRAGLEAMVDEIRTRRAAPNN